MACVVNEFEEKCWVPGIIQSKLIATKPCCMKCMNIKMFKILYFNGQEGENTENELLKINKYTYGSIVNDIRNKLGISSNIMPFNDVNKHDKSLFTVGTETDRETLLDESTNAGHVKEAEIKEIKTEIVSEIKVYFDSCNL